jgi:hypothetical protein
MLFYRQKVWCIFLADQNNLRLAVLIDADNVPRDSLKYAMDEIAIYGTPPSKGFTATGRARISAAGSSHCWKTP